MGYGAIVVSPTTCTITTQFGGPVGNSCPIGLTGTNTWTATDGAILQWTANSGVDGGVTIFLKLAGNPAIGTHTYTDASIAGQTITVTVNVIAPTAVPTFSNGLGVADSALAGCTNSDPTVFLLYITCPDAGHRPGGTDNPPAMGATYTTDFGFTSRLVAPIGIQYVGLRTISYDNQYFITDNGVYKTDGSGLVAGNPRLVNTNYLHAHALNIAPYTTWAFVSPYSSPSIGTMTMDGMGGWINHGAIFTNPRGTAPGNGVGHGGEGFPTATGWIGVISCDDTWLYIANLFTGAYAELQMSTLGVDNLVAGSTALSSACGGPSNNPDSVYIEGPDDSGKYKVWMTIDYTQEIVIAQRTFEFDPATMTITYTGLGPTTKEFRGYPNQVTRGSGATIAGGWLANVTCLSNLCTANTTVAHNRTKSDAVRVYGATVDTDLNHGWVVTTVPTTTSFTFRTLNVTNNVYTDGGMGIAYIPSWEQDVTTTNAKTYAQAFPEMGNHNTIFMAGQKVYFSAPWERNTSGNYANFQVGMCMSCGGLSVAAKPLFTPGGGGWFYGDQIGSHHGSAALSPYYFGTSAGQLGGFEILTATGSSPVTLNIPGAGWTTGQAVLLGCPIGAGMSGLQGVTGTVTALGGNVYTMNIPTSGVYVPNQCGAVENVSTTFTGAQVQVNRVSKTYGVFQSRRLGDSRSVNWSWDNYGPNPFGDISPDGSLLCYGSNWGYPNGTKQTYCIPTGFNALLDNELSLTGRVVTPVTTNTSAYFSILANSTTALTIQVYTNVALSNLVTTVTSAGGVAYPVSQTSNTATGLTQNTTYHYVVTSNDFKDKAVGSFTTTNYSVIIDRFNGAIQMFGGLFMQ